MKDIYYQYTGRIDKYSSLIKKQNETLNFYSALRFIAFVAGIISGIYLYKIRDYILCMGASAIFLTIFIILVNRHKKVKENKEYAASLIDINKKSLDRLNGDWRNFQDTGEELLEDSHRYARDLDIFGEGSLFQWINSSETVMGRQKLQVLLTKAPESINEILIRQQGINELSLNIKWRQRLNAEAIITAKNKKLSDNEALYNWIRQDEFVIFSGGELISKILPGITLLLFIISFSTGLISENIPYTMLIIQMLLLYIFHKRMNPVLDAAFTYKNNIILYDKIIRHIEKKDFKSEYLVKLKENLLCDGVKASVKINKLVKVVNLISDRNNMLYIVLNIIFLWDMNCVIALEKWRKESGALIKKWLDTIGEFEALSSLSVINFDNPDWVKPTFTEEFPVLRAREAGHPLISRDNVCNDIIINENSPVLLITGSNMSGKSTYLRTSGLNLVLAYAGAAVNAREFVCSLMNVYTCMRVSDNLEKNISSFYAEILKIKEIVTASREKGKVYFLLDEIFKGTNSIDRHAGAKALINKLINENSAGMVSTHDLELGELETSTSGKVSNFHFEEYYKNGELKFDYKLKKGISKTRNAMYLLRMAGIEQED